jgi:hypothetical protein
MLPVFPLSRADAMQRLEQLSQDIQSIVTPVTLEASIGGQKTSSKTEAPSLSAELVIQRPNNIHLRANYWGIANAFDIVTNGDKYQVLIPTKKKLYEGKEDGPPVAPIGQDPLVNAFVDIRPKQIQQALLIDLAALLADPNIKVAADPLPFPLERKTYFIIRFYRGESRDLEPVENVWFDLTSKTHEVVRRQIFGKDGQIAVDVRFANWKPTGSNAVAFPSDIQIDFPEREIVLKMSLDPVKVVLNESLTPEKFQLPDNTAEIITLKPKDAANTAQ